MEYGLLVGIISVVMMSALLVMGPTLANTFTSAEAGLLSKSP